MNLLAQVYFFTFSGKKDGEIFKGNGEFWLDFKDRPDNIYDFRSVESAVAYTLDLTEVKIEGSLTPLRFVERHGQNKVFFGQGSPFPEPEVPQSNAEL